MAEPTRIIVPETAYYGGTSGNQCAAGQMAYHMTALFSNSITEQRVVFHPLSEISSRLSFEMTSPSNAAFLLSVYSNWKSGRGLEVRDRSLSFAEYVHVFYGFVLRASVYVSAGDSSEGDTGSLCCGVYLASLKEDGVLDDEEMIYLVRIPMIQLLFWLDTFVFSRPGVDYESIIGSFLSDKDDDIGAFIDHIYLKNYLTWFFDNLFKSSLADNPCLTNILFGKIRGYIANRLDLISQAQHTSNQHGSSDDGREYSVMVLDCKRLYARNSEINDSGTSST